LCRMHMGVRSIWILEPAGPRWEETRRSIGRLGVGLHSPGLTGGLGRHNCKGVCNMAHL
jgi:hypothetical protein